ncbi:hypothetical protein C4D60_Mb11t23200 [Musa balbisiana]|uniref:Uncharacterized protein n=1 Tax=Musa balbisiana TaxID=52838 RepID=A0A4V4H5R1_MUSBA|nr:hypothetical protein C4D60_Mb11t23200 [Musa balbisiana]
MDLLPGIIADQKNAALKVILVLLSPWSSFPELLLQPLPGTCQAADQVSEYQNLAASKKYLPSQSASVNLANGHCQDH